MKIGQVPYHDQNDKNFQSFKTLFVLVYLCFDMIDFVYLTLLCTNFVLVQGKIGLLKIPGVALIYVWN